MDQELWDKIHAQIGARRTVWRLKSREIIDIGKKFESGGGVTPGELQKLRKTWLSKSPFVDADGRPFVLYIYDQSLHHQFANSYQSGGQSEYKFHFTECSTLLTMFAGGRQARYKGKYDVNNNIFTVNQGDRKKDKDIIMHVCKNCLSHMDYNGYASQYSRRGSIYNSFDIAAFFAKHGPQNLKNPTHQNFAADYTDDWPTVRERIKKERNYKCEKCGLDKPGPLDVHHKNGVKSDNSPSNLAVLHRSCHASEPFHAHMRNILPNSELHNTIFPLKS